VRLQVRIEETETLKKTDGENPTEKRMRRTAVSSKVKTVEAQRAVVKVGKAETDQKRGRPMIGSSAEKKPGAGSQVRAKGVSNNN